MDMEQLMLLMDDLYIWVLQLKASCKKDSPQLILCLVVPTIAFNMYIFKLTGTTNLHKISANPSTNCRIHVNILAQNALASVFLGLSIWNTLRKRFAAWPGGGLSARRISGPIMRNNNITRYTWWLAHYKRAPHWLLPQQDRRLFKDALFSFWMFIISHSWGFWHLKQKPWSDQLQACQTELR